MLLPFRAIGFDAGVAAPGRVPRTAHHGFNDVLTRPVAITLIADRNARGEVVSGFGHAPLSTLRKRTPYDGAARFEQTAATPFIAPASAGSGIWRLQTSAKLIDPLSRYRARR